MHDKDSKVSLRKNFKFLFLIWQVEKGTGVVRQIRLLLMAISVTRSLQHKS